MTCNLVVLNEVITLKHEPEYNKISNKFHFYYLYFKGESKTSVFSKLVFMYYISNLCCSSQLSYKKK